MKLPRSLLECVRNNFLMQLLNKPARGGGLLHLFLCTEKDLWVMWGSETILGTMIAK